MDEALIFILGSKGQLGTALQNQYPGAQSADSHQLDITDADSWVKYDWSNVKYIINAAAYTKVDGAESAEGRIAAWKANATAVGYITKVAIDHDITVIHISSDYVFDGSNSPHTEAEPYSPLGVYGQSKAAGDLIVSLAPKHYLLRASWVIGAGPNFVKTMLGLGQKGIAPTVVADQVGRLTFTSELVRAIDHLLTTQAAYGTYNVSNGGESASWADITREIFRAAKINLPVTDTTTADYFASKAGVAPRPLNSTLDLSKLQATGFEPRDWRDDLQAYIEKELTQ